MAVFHQVIEKVIERNKHAEQKLQKQIFINVKLFVVVGFSSLQFPFSHVCHPVLDWVGWMNGWLVDWLVGWMDVIVLQNTHALAF